MIDKLHPDEYSIENLEKRKSDREKGALAKLKGLGELTEDRLQEMLAYSIKEASREVREMLAEHQPLDPDAAMIVSEAANHLNTDTAEVLYEASSMLTPALNEHADILWQAADRLVPALDEYAEMLSSAADRLVPALNNHVATPDSAAEYLPELIVALDARIAQLRNLMDMTAQRNRSWSPPSATPHAFSRLATVSRALLVLESSTVDGYQLIPNV